MGSYRLTSKARAGLFAIVAYVDENFGEDLTDRVLDRLLSTFRSLVEHPGLGHRREDLTLDDSIRFRSLGPTLVAYRRVGVDIEILFVERGERDWEAMLQGEGE